MPLMFSGGVPLFTDGHLSFCEDDCYCLQDSCASCCSYAFWTDPPTGDPELWGTFNGDGDLEEVTTYDGVNSSTITETLTAIMPVKNSRVVCDGDSVRFTLTYSTTETGGDNYDPDAIPFVQWNRSWTAVCNGDDCAPGVIDDADLGIVEDRSDDAESLSIELRYSACWDEYGTLPEVVWGSREYGTPRRLTINPCLPNTRCCEHTYECAPCCIYVTSPKIMAEVAETTIAGLGDAIGVAAGVGENEVVAAGQFLFAARDDASGTGLYVTALPDGGAKRTVCPTIDEAYTDATNAGNTLELVVKLVPQNLNPVIGWDQELCIEFDPEIWEPPAAAVSVCGGRAKYCLDTPPADIDDPGGTEWSVVMNLKCYDFGTDPTAYFDRARIGVTVTDLTDAGTETYVDYDSLSLEIPFGTCGSTETCCPVVTVACDDCCVAYDRVSGPIIDLAIVDNVDGGSVSGTMVFCSGPDDTSPAELDIVITPARFCVGETIGIEINKTGVIAGEICVTVTGDFDQPLSAEPAPDSLTATKACWDSVPATITMSADVLCKNDLSGATVTVEVAGEVVDFIFRGCGDAECCCEEYIPCCGPDCYYPVFPDGVLTEEGGTTSTDAAGAFTVENFTMTATTAGGEVYDWIQDSIPNVNWNAVNIKEPGCPTEYAATLAGPPGNLQLDVKILIDDVLQGSRNSVDFDFCDGETIEVNTGGIGVSLTFTTSNPGGCSGTVTGSTTDSNGITYTIEFDVVNAKPFPALAGGSSCIGGLLHTFEGGVWRKVLKSEFPEDFFDVAEVI